MTTAGGMGHRMHHGEMTWIFTEDVSAGHSSRVVLHVRNLQKVDIKW